MLKLSKIATGLALAAAIMLTSCAATHRGSYTDRLVALQGTPYLTLDCAGYICAARQHSHCGAASIFNGCNGSMVVVKEVSTFAEAINAKELQPGDVADFHGIHVAAYIGNGIWMDSNPDHYGVGRMNLQPNPHDLWYTGPIRIMRWQ